MKNLKLFVAAVVLIVLTIGHYQVFATTNLALSGIATQSSTGYWDWWATPDRAIDGNTDGDYWNGSVSHTDYDFHAWWQVDLNNMYPLESIVLWNRTDGCGDRLTNFNVSVLDKSLSQVWSQNYYTSGGTFLPSMTINLPINTYGQIVKVQLNGTNYLQLAEVQVYGDQIPIPEPSTFFMLGMGLFGLIGFVYKRKKS